MSSSHYPVLVHVFCLLGKKQYVCCRAYGLAHMGMTAQLTAVLEAAGGGHETCSFLSNVTGVFLF